MSMTVLDRMQREFEDSFAYLFQDSLKRLIAVTRQKAKAIIHLQNLEEAESPLMTPLSEK